MFPLEKSEQDNNPTNANIASSVTLDLPLPSFAPAAPLLPNVESLGMLAESRVSVATELVAFAKRRIMSSSFDREELASLLEMARSAGYAEGYAQAKLDIALGQTTQRKIIPSVPAPPLTAAIDDNPVEKSQKLEALKEQAAKSEEAEMYVTKTTVSTAKAIALDYLKNASPKVVGPTEIIKNSKKMLNVVITFGTLKRAIEALLENGEIEQIEPSRWRYKSRPDNTALRSVR